jgi:hypothetical protein
MTMTPSTQSSTPQYCNTITVATGDTTTNYFLRYTYNDVPTDTLISNLFADTNTPGYYIYRLCSSTLVQLGLNGAIVTPPMEWDFNIDNTLNSCSTHFDCT